jgi:coniferyl-aldehyde dehydrogenase
MFGATAWVKYQPKGVIGIIGTWNAPLFTLLSPLACAFAAGNRAVLKPSEIAPRTAQVLAEAVARRFDPQVLAVVQGGPDVAAAFAEQPWNHLVFTGSTSVGKLIMAAAARNLVPVTLELGGKSPCAGGRFRRYRQCGRAYCRGQVAQLRPALRVTRCGLGP